MNAGTGKIYFQTLLSVTAIVLSIIALYFSWQANKLSSRPVPPQVAVLDVQWVHTLNTSPDLSDGALACGHKFRLVNLGGIPVALTGYRVKISLGDSELIYEELLGVTSTTGKLPPQVGHFKIYLFSGEHIPKSPLDTESALQFPYEIDSHSTSEIVMDTGFSYDPTLRITGGPNDFVRSMQAEGYTPMSLSYVFITETRQEVSSPLIYCAAFK